MTPNAPASAPARRVVVTGCGVVTAHGIGWSANAAGFRSGRPTFGPVTVFDASHQRVRTAAEVRLPDGTPTGFLRTSTVRRIDRAGRMLLWAASEACTQSGWRAGDRVSLVLGTTSGGMALGEAYYRAATDPQASVRHQAERVRHYQAHQQAADVLGAHGFRGPATVIANACASGANAVGHGWRLVRRGMADRVLAGGYDALCHLVFAGFDALQALSPTTCRPFAADRDGLALGEGAAVMCLESLESARARGAEILGEVCGYGAATDIHHLTQPHPEGTAALASMTAACAAAGVGPGDIGYVNAHGTGTPLNDGAEAAALNAWAGERAGALRVSSTKAGIGHLLGAAGAVEAAVCLMVLREGWLPPGGDPPTVDPACRFGLVRKPVDARCRHVLTNSFGFGGANASLVLGVAP